MLSHDMQKLILQIHKSPFGIYSKDQNIYKHQRSFYRALAYLKKKELIESVHIPVVDETRIVLKAKGKMLGLILEEIEEIKE